MKLRYRSAFCSCNLVPEVPPFAVKIHLYKTCRHCLGMVSEEWDLSLNEATAATGGSMNELILQPCMIGGTLITMQ